jgi:hypothetical protein
MVNNGVWDAMRSTRARVATAVAGVIGMLAVATATGFFQFLVLGLCTCGGDGGSPYAAHDSAQGRVCDVLDHGALTAVAALELAALVAAAVVIGLWAARRVRGRLAAVVAVAGALLPLGALIALSAPTDNCSKADQAAYSTWLDQGARGEPPADCDSY